MTRTYSELLSFKTFEDRFRYLELGGVVGQTTFSHDRYLNQALYKSVVWRDLREQIIIRDGACDLGVPGYELKTGVVVHHIIPITVEDILNRRPIVFSEDNLITTSTRTHRAIHFGDIEMVPKGPNIRTKGDTKLW